MSNIQIPVLIVGAGPVGLTLGCNLQRMGIKTRIIDKRATAASTSKALTINAASLKLFHGMGLIEKFLSAGQKVEDIYVHWQNRRLSHVNYRRLVSAYPYFLSLPQPETEKILAENYVELGGSVHRSVNLVKLQQQNNQVQVTLNYHTTSVVSETYNYVIGCDGAKSTVRNLLGKKFLGHDYGIYFLLVDTKLHWEGDKTATHYFVQEKGFIIVIPLPNGRHRIVIKEEFTYSDPNKQRTLADYQRLVDTYGPGNIRLEKIFWESQAPFYNRLAEVYNQEKIFLAGDASHLFSPIGGLGMNTGLQDALNLGWKLGGVIKNKLHPIILESYQAERREIAQQLLKSTDISTCLITRINKDEQGPLQQWLPVAKNRERLKTLWPLNFSGLGQTYSPSNLINSEKKSNLLGAHAPYAVGLDQNKQWVSSYDFADAVNFSLLVFSNDIAESFKKLISNHLTTYPYKIIFITKNKNIKKQENTQIITDEYGAFFSSFSATEGDLFLIRPDGYIGYVSQLSRNLSCKQYFDSFFKGALS